MRKFVMGDIHGNYKALVQCLERSGFNKREDQLIQLGDVVDGYHDSYECVGELLTIENCIAIRGNHDDWFLEFIETGYHPDNWRQGGKATAASYHRHSVKKHLAPKSSTGYGNQLDIRDIPFAHQNFFRSQVPYYIDKDNNCFVHGGFDQMNTFYNQRPEIYYWDRELWSDAVNYQGKQPFYIKTEFNNIFIGHTSTLCCKTDLPVRAQNIYNLDTGAGSKNGKLTIMNLATKEFFQSDLTS